MIRCGLDDSNSESEPAAYAGRIVTHEQLALLKSYNLYTRDEDDIAETGPAFTLCLE